MSKLYNLGLYWRTKEFTRGGNYFHNIGLLIGEVFIDITRLRGGCTSESGEECGI